MALVSSRTPKWQRQSSGTGEDRNNLMLAMQFAAFRQRRPYLSMRRASALAQRRERSLWSAGCSSTAAGAWARSLSCMRKTSASDRRVAPRRWR